MQAHQRPAGKLNGGRGRDDAHTSGEIFFGRRAAWQVASTMGFVLNKNTGSFMGLTQAEESALHEVSRLFFSTGIVP